jgi:hypothetical protein
MRPQRLQFRQAISAASRFRPFDEPFSADDALQAGGEVGGYHLRAALCAFLTSMPSHTVTVLVRRRERQMRQAPKQGARTREQRLRAREERARLEMLTEKVAVRRSAKIIPGWVPLAGAIFGVTFNIIVSITAVWLGVWSAAE